MTLFVIEDEYDQEIFEAEDAEAAEAYGYETTTDAQTWFADVEEAFTYEATIREIVMDADDEDGEDWDYVEDGIEITITREIASTIRLCCNYCGIWGNKEEIQRSKATGVLVCKSCETKDAYDNEDEEAA